MLGHNPTQMDSYNKNTQCKATTLMANWFQQKVHLQNKGQGRTVTRFHIPKKHQQLMNSQNLNIKVIDDDTKYRILGNTNYPLNRPTNYHYGKGQNKADAFPKTGRKQQLVQQMEQARKGIFKTTNKQAFVAKPLNQNIIGRLNMYDQNGRPVQIQNVDQDLKISNGLKDRGQITPDSQLQKIIDTNVGFQRQQPLTFWRQKLQNGTFYVSKLGSNLVFAKNNEFLKTFKHYKHYHD